MNLKSNANKINRRDFFKTAGIGATALAIKPDMLFSRNMKRNRKVRIGIIGGRFGLGFQFQNHPDCIVEAVSDLIPERRNDLIRTYRCSKSYESLEKLVKDPKVDAVFIATGAPDHARHVIASLKAGKHVLCAVPAAMTIDECHEILETVKKTGLKYMMAETSVWRQRMISVKQFYKEDAFGNFIGFAAQYNHPGLETLYFENGEKTWRHGLPPMLYPTHCTSFVVGLTRERLTEVSCIGWGDNDPILQDNIYNNPFWNESAHFKTSNGLPFSVEVNWKGALRPSERGEWHGDKMSFIMSHGPMSSTVLVKAGAKRIKDDGGFDVAENSVEEYNTPNWWSTDMLPEPLRHDSGHEGSHTFITHEFIDSIVTDRTPEVDIYQALAMTAPGIVAHASAMKGGELLKIPSFDK
ncbi:Gfo/Idh/MocA family protein [Petrimonas mucosa]|jgi:predicted dehydrogenase|uniref:Glycosyl hydrolase family 109 protein n=1 Tax=Petrimonas mucosa TaxID=1642646 RepID=A0A1G4G8F3_9BACT|nr:Gfo/Idh/MocA family oxidoreductase [Petrimonas mucosa]MDD3561975.1 Gfo/Idh/MocA family oxidoreductase [Petrimonas mucosa]SCM58758.1 Glycosyl hydrolase family 109 protein [Petrimonas mucosa]SFU69448.1 Predicted dehydrogenase [Porphyromonadaceae bacterium KHP3R9]